MRGASPVLAVENVSKAFPGVVALRGVSLGLLPGQIHGLVGENGAGKSTLMRIMTGFYQPDAGTIYLQGERVRFESPAHSRHLGISMVYQDTRLVGDLDVVQNISLGRLPGRAGLMDRRAMTREAEVLLARLGMPLDPHRPVRELSLAERQSVEIARALSIDSSVLILDEPTTGLDSGEVEHLFEILRALRAQGTAIVLISHRLPEIMSVADVITVMKDGCVVATLPVAGQTQDEIVRLMVGRDIHVAFPPKGAERGPVVLEVQHLRSPGAFSDISFSLSQGEVVGLGGIQGNGQREIARALAGLLPARGRILLDGQHETLSSTSAAIERGIVYLSSDRRGESLFLPHSVGENIVLPHVGAFSRSGVIDRERVDEAVSRTIHDFRIQTPSAAQPVEFLSGGNQQKVAVGRWLLSRPRVYIFDEPTQGVDVGTKLELYRTVRQLANDGAAVLILSTDLIELLGLCDRTIVIADGRIVDVVDAADATEERIVGSAVTACRDDGAQAGQRRRGGWLSSANWMIARWSSPALVLLLVLLLGWFTSQRSPYFLRPMNMSDLALQIAPLALVSMGEMAALLVGGIDLSVGPMMSLTTVIASFLIVSGSGDSAALGLLVCLAAGGLVGLTNGALVRYLKLPDLIATLATYSAVFGISLILRPAPGGALNPAFMSAVTFRIGFVPVASVLVLILFIIGEVVLLRGKIGMALYATGSNREAAMVAGIPVDRVRMGAYVFSSIMAVLAGLILAARIGGGDPQSGANFTLAAVTAVVVGGTSIFGGRGSLVGTLIGSVLIVETQNALNQLHASAYYQYIWIGALTLLAVTIYSVRENAGGFQRLRLLFGARPSACDTEGEAPGTARQ